MDIIYLLKNEVLVLVFTIKPCIFMGIITITNIYCYKKASDKIIDDFKTAGLTSLNVSKISYNSVPFDCDFLD